MGMVIKNKSGYYTVLTDEFLKSIEQTNDTAKLKKHLRYFCDLVETNLSIQDKSEIPDGIIARVYGDYMNKETKEDGYTL